MNPLRSSAHLLLCLLALLTGCHTAPAPKAPVLPSKAAAPALYPPLPPARQARAPLPSRAPVDYVVQPTNEFSRLIIAGRPAIRRDARTATFAPASVDVTTGAPSVSIQYRKDITYDGQPADSIYILAVQQAGFGLRIDYSEDLMAWGTLAEWGPYPVAQPVDVEWIRYLPSQRFPHVFFRAVNTE